MAAPNIVCIVADDLGWRDLGCTGSDFYETPRIDALAASSVRFGQAYSPAPNCSPSRACLLTGRAPARIGLTQIVGGHGVGQLLDVPSFGQLPRQEYTYARALRTAGYRTWHVGKWHLGPAHSWPERHGFDVNVGGCDAGKPRSWMSPYQIPTLTDGPEGEHLTDRLTDEAISLLRQASNDRDEGGEQRPFLLNLWHYSVHTPLTHAPADLVEHFSEKAREQGHTTDDEVEEVGPYPYWRADTVQLRRRTAQGNPVYAAMVAHLDAAVGRILDELDRLGLSNNTVVIFTSDNGGLHTGPAPTANTPLADGKGWLTEGGIRIPLIMRWPDGGPSGTVDETPVTLADIYPTMVEWAGGDRGPGQQLDGSSLAGLVDGRDTTLPDRPLFWHFPHYTYTGARPASAVRHGRWKLIRRYEEQRDQLFDLESDPGELLDLSESEPDQCHRLTVLLDDWLADVRGVVPGPNPIEPFDEYAHGPASVLRR